MTIKQKDAWEQFKDSLKIKVNIYPTRLVRDFNRLANIERKVIYFYHGLDGKHKRSWEELRKKLVKSYRIKFKYKNGKERKDYTYYTSDELQAIYVKAINSLKTILKIKTYTDYLEEQGKLGEIVKYNFVKNNRSYDEITFSEYENSL